MGIPRPALFKLFVAGFICYFNTLNNPFIWDDEVTIVNNQLIKSWKHFPEVFKTSMFGEKMKGISYFRPVQTISYFLDYSLWKLNVRGYHIVNILLHIFNAYLVFLILNCIFRPFFYRSGSAKNRRSAGATDRRSNKTFIPLIVSLLFVIHPVHTEAVTYISGRGDLLAVFFSLLCFFFFIRRHFFPSIIFFVIALFAKENAVVLPFIILSYFFLIHHPSQAGTSLRKENYHKVTLFILLLISGVYIFFRMLFVYYANTSSLSAIRDASFFERVLTLPRILFTYIRLLILPIHLHMEYLFVEKSLSSAYVWAGIPFLVFLFYFFYSFRLATKSSGDDLRGKAGEKSAVFFILWFLIGLVPFYNIAVPLHATLLEHWVYFPSIGLLTLIVCSFPPFLEKMVAPKKLTIMVSRLLLAGFVIFFAFTTIKRNAQWSDKILFYSHDLRYEPKSFLLWNNLGVEFYRKGLFPDAKAAFLKAIAVSPGNRYAVSHNNLGVIYENEGKIKDAVSLYKRSIELDNYVLAYGNLGRILILQKKFNEAAEILKKGFVLYPYDAEIKKCLEILQKSGE